METLHSPPNKSPDQQHQQQWDSQPAHPLLIPELVLAVGLHLSQAQALQAVLVCKIWYACLIPTLYQRVTLGRKKQTYNGTKKPQRPMLGVLHRYGTHVRTLLCPENYAALRLAAPLCCSIETLILGWLSDEVLEILRRNKETVRRLEFRRSKTPLTFAESRKIRFFPPNHVLEIMDQMPQLRTLSVSTLVLRTGTQASLFFGIYERLEALELSGDIQILVSSLENSWRTNTKLRSLALIDCKLSTEQELGLLSHCPNLQHFLKRDEGYCAIGHYFSQWAAESPVIKSFSYTSPNASDGEIARAIGLLPKLERLDVRGSKFGSLCHQWIVHQFCEQIRILDLTDCANVEPGMVNRIMCCCPRLTSLSADKMKAEDVIESRWVCLELEELQVTFVANGAGLSLYPVQCGVYDQLSKLRKLRLLSISRGTNSSRSILQLNLDSGLARLSQLKELREIGFEQQDDRISSFRVGMAELQWMLKHWPRLEGIYGTLSPDPNWGNFMKTFLERERPGIRIKTQLNYLKRNAWPDSLANV